MYQKLDGCLRGDNNGRTLIGMAKKLPWLLSQLFRITPDAMSKTSLDFGFFCNVNQNLKAWCFLHLYSCVFPAVNHLSGPLRKQKFTPTGPKGHCDWWILMRFVGFCVSRFVAFELHLSCFHVLALESFDLLTETWQVYISNVKLFL